MISYSNSRPHKIEAVVGSGKEALGLVVNYKW